MMSLAITCRGILVIIFSPKKIIPELRIQGNFFFEGYASRGLVKIDNNLTAEGL